MQYCQYLKKQSNPIQHLHTDFILDTKNVRFTVLFFDIFKWTALFCNAPQNNQQDYIYGALKIQYNNI